LRRSDEDTLRTRGYFWPRWYSAFCAVFNIGGGELLLLRGTLPAWACLTLIFLGLCNLQVALRPRSAPKEQQP